MQGTCGGWISPGRALTQFSDFCLLQSKSTRSSEVILRRIGGAMNIKQMAVGIVWLGFATLAVLAFLHDGKAAFALPFDSLTNIAGMIDLFIELTLVSIWMY